MSKKGIAILLVVLGLAVVGYWVATGAYIFSQEQVMVEKEVEDEIFGTTTTEKVWVDEYHPGLEVIGPIAGVLFLAALILFIWDRRQMRGNSQPEPNR